MGRWMDKNLNSPAHKIQTLRAAMARAGVDAFLVPHADIYGGEFVGPGAERLMWMTGFTGSAGVGVVMAGRAAVMTDGRYTLQAAAQIDPAIYEVVDITKTTIVDYLARHMAAGQVIGMDAWLHTPNQFEAMRTALKDKSIEIKLLDGFVDSVFHNLPDLRLRGDDKRRGDNTRECQIFPETIAGATIAQKKQLIELKLKEKNVFANVLNMPDSMMWILNVRGRDIETTPVVLSMGIVYADGRKMKWFVDPGKVTESVRKHVEPYVEIISFDLIEKCIGDLAVEAKLPIALDFARAPLWFKNKIENEGGAVLDMKDPCILPRAVKTTPEQAAIRAAHVADGVAVVKFLKWLEDTAPQKTITELDVVERLEAFRREDAAYQGPSFDTIAGFGANGAIIHYRATKETNRSIISPGILLLDSGGQYHYGTTDITRTIAIGAPTDEQRRNFTLVLKGHIAVASARFSSTTTGAQIDALARAPLKEHALDYAHGTGHGVGCYLSVHEESASISARGHEPLLPGMLLSNEPGYYKEGEYGIRIESLVFVRDDGDKIGFETITLAPIDLNLVDPDILNSHEKRWLNDYHAEVFKALSPLLEPDLAGWLARRTVALKV
jgi:Xaa-Pro aminopeptidase